MTDDMFDDTKPDDPAPVVKDPVEDAIAAQKAEWIKFGQTTQRDLAAKYDDTAKTLIGLFSGIFAIFSFLFAFFGLPSQVNISLWVAILTIICFTISIICLVYVLGPSGTTESVNYYDSDEIWDKTVRKNQKDHRHIMIGITFFIIAILLIPGSIVISMFTPGQDVRIVTSQDKIVYLRNASVSFQDNSTVSDEMQLIRQDTTTYTFKLTNGNVVKINKDWVQAIVTKS